MRMIRAYPVIANVLLPTVSVRPCAARSRGRRSRRWCATPRAGSATPTRSSTATRRVGVRRARGDWSTDAARALVAAGIEPGDRVAVWAPNSLEWIVAALGVTTAGGVLVPVNTRFKGAEAAYVLARSGARGAVHRPRLPRHRLSRAARRAPACRLPALEHTVLLAGAPDDADDRRGTSSSRAATTVPAAERRRARRRRSAPTTRATSCSRRARPAARRAS